MDTKGLIKLNVTCDLDIACIVNMQHFIKVNCEVICQQLDFDKVYAYANQSLYITFSSEICQK